MEQLTGLYTTLNSFALIPPAELEKLRALICVRNLGKGDFFLRQGDFPESVAYIASGLFRVYFSTVDGDEKTHAFRAEKRFLSGLSSFIERMPASYSIQALEDSVLICLDLENLRILMQRNACWEKVYLGPNSFDF